MERKEDRCSSCRRRLFIESRERQRSSLPIVSKALMILSNLAGRPLRMAIAVSSSSKVTPIEMSKVASFRTRFCVSK